MYWFLGDPGHIESKDYQHQFGSSGLGAGAIWCAFKRVSKAEKQQGPRLFLVKALIIVFFFFFGSTFA